MRGVNQTFQLVPPHIHRRNSEERAIRKFKEHFIAILTSTHKDFPIHLWCRHLTHASITLDLLWQPRMNPKLYGYAQIHGGFKYNYTPIALSGTQVIFHEKPTMRRTRASHVVKVWHLGPSMEHYIFHCVYITKHNRGAWIRLCWFFFAQYYTPFTSLSQKMSSSRRTNFPVP